MGIVQRFAATVTCLGALIAGTGVKAADIKLMTTGAVEFILRDLIPPFERATGHKVNMMVIGTATAVDRIKDGAPTDLVLLNPEAVDDLIKAKKVVPGTIVHVFHSRAGVAVRAGAPKPDISTVEAFRQALLKATTIGHSLGASGAYFSTNIIPRLGIADQIKDKIRIAKGFPVGVLVAKGEAEIGIHQISEIVGQPGVTLVGPLPAEIQNYTVYVVGLGTGAKEAEAAKAFIKVLTGPSAAGVLKSKGMEGA